MDDLGAIPGREAILVFGDVPGGTGAEFEFLPFRRARLRGFRPPELVRNKALYNDDTHIAIDFVLDRLVWVAQTNVDDVIERWTAALRKLDQRPRPAGHDQAGATHFMFSAPDVGEGDAVGDDIAWRPLVERLAACTSLDGAYFFRVAALRRRGKDQVLELSRDDKREEYSLETNGEYNLLLDAYSTSSEPAPADALETLATSDRLLIENPSTSALGTGSRVEIDLTAGAVQAPTRTTLVVQGKGVLGDKAPRIELAMRIAPRPFLVVAAIAVIAVGTAISGLSKSDLGTHHGYVVVIVKAIGVLMVAGGLYWASRRAPGVAK